MEKFKFAIQLVVCRLWSGMGGHVKIYLFDLTRTFISIAFYPLTSHRIFRVSTLYQISRGQTKTNENRLLVTPEIEWQPYTVVRVANTFLSYKTDFGLESFDVYYALVAFKWVTICSLGTSGPQTVTFAISCKSQKSRDTSEGRTNVYCLAEKKFKKEKNWLVTE